MAGDYLRRTAITRLVLTDEQRQTLEETLNEWKTACNIASRTGWKTGETQKTRLQRLAYDDVREQTSIGSQHAILAIHQAASALTGVEEIEDLEEDYDTSRPSFTSDTLTYDARTMTVFDDDSVSLATFGDGDRIRCELALPDDETGYQRQYLDDSEWELTESTLSKRDGE